MSLTLNDKSRSLTPYLLKNKSKPQPIALSEIKEKARLEISQGLGQAKQDIPQFNYPQLQLDCEFQDSLDKSSDGIQKAKLLWGYITKQVLNSQSLTIQQILKNFREEQETQKRIFQKFTLGYQKKLQNLAKEQKKFHQKFPKRYTFKRFDTNISQQCSPVKQGSLKLINSSCSSLDCNSNDNSKSIVNDYDYDKFKKQQLLTAVKQTINDGLINSNRKIDQLDNRNFKLDISKSQFFKKRKKSNNRINIKLRNQSQQNQNKYPIKQTIIKDLNQTYFTKSRQSTIQNSFMNRSVQINRKLTQSTNYLSQSRSSLNYSPDKQLKALYIKFRQQESEKESIKSQIIHNKLDKSIDDLTISYSKYLI